MALIYPVLIKRFLLTQRDLETVLNFQTIVRTDLRFPFLFYLNISLHHFPVGSARLETLLEIPRIFLALHFHWVVLRLWSPRAARVFASFIKRSVHFTILPSNSLLKIRNACDVIGSGMFNDTEIQD